MNKIKVIINGETIELQNSSNVAQMVAEREVTGSMFVIEKNREIVQKEDYTTTYVKENDVFEIVGFFGGG